MTLTKTPVSAALVSLLLGTLVPLLVPPDARGRLPLLALGAAVACLALGAALA
jgi:hypothetical protein